MPIYEYECSKCGHRFEEWAGISDQYPKCPECGAENPDRLISLTGVGQVEMSARDLYEKKIRPEAREIANRIRQGDESAAADILGEN